MHVCVYECRGLQGLEEAVGSPEPGVIGGFEQPNLDTGN